MSKMEGGIGPLQDEETVRTMAGILGKDGDELLVMADKVATDVTATIKNEPANARFLRVHPNLTKDLLGYTVSVH